MHNDSYCPLPWKHSVIRMDGTIALCCSYSSSTPYNIKDVSINEYWHSNYMNTVRKDMSAGVHRAECESCYAAESRGLVSRRQDSIEHWGLADFEQLPIDVEFHVSNLCNAKCLICRPRDSSTYASEDRMMGLIPQGNKRYDEATPISDERLEETLNALFANGLDTIDLRGGESMMVPRSRKILSELKPDLVKNTTLKVQSNGTKFDAIWEEIFKKFKHVELMLSIDAYQDDNYYFRYPCKWESIVDAIERVKQIDNVSWFINTTIGNLNVLTLPKLFDWVIKNQYIIHLSFINHPAMLATYNLPEDLAHLAADRLDKYKGKFILDKTNENLEVFINSLRTTAKPTLWKQFVDYIQQRDSFRKNSILEVIPEMEAYFA